MDLVMICRWQRPRREVQGKGTGGWTANEDARGATADVQMINNDDNCEHMISLFILIHSKTNPGMMKHNHKLINSRQPLYVSIDHPGQSQQYFPSTFSLTARLSLDWRDLSRLLANLVTLLLVLWSSPAPNQGRFLPETVAQGGSARWGKDG